ncbi:MAG: ATP synthase F1 subunit delta [Marinilabiliales bacterium]|nr:MAG: ATP synthase F1 subunit delta [Marinilabiliales bacterium]
MNISKISVRYAKAVFLLAKEKNVLDHVYADFVLLRETISSTPEFKEVICSPVISPKDKLRVLTNVYGKIIHDITSKFLDLVIEKNREIYLLDIARNFEVLYRKENNIKQVIVTTHQSISNKVSETVSGIIAKTYNSKVEVKNMTDDEMIGGIIIRVDNQQLDLSVKTQLNEIKKNLQKKSYQKQI